MISINLFIVWQGVYLYEYVNDWKKFSETILPEKEDFYGKLKMEEITVGD